MCDACGWEDAQALAEDLAKRGSDFARRLLETWFDHASHVTDAQWKALEQTKAAFDAFDEGEAFDGGRR
jgi:hypothetical protein